ncbi:MAG TPA: phosphate ABC transporter substrate-binding protein PstS [Solirubrobacterales bacterium]
MRTKDWLLAIGSSAVLALGGAACGDADSDASGSTGNGGSEEVALSGEIAGAGASSQEAAKEAWIAGFQEQHPDVTISYDPVGSGGGREQFIAGGTQFGGTDSPLEGQELRDAKDRCAPGELIQIPVYISPIAVVYNLPEVEQLQLSPETLAGIFNQDITNWNDPAIAADNPGVELPDLRITPVNRSDESGTTENFTDYLSKAAPDVWTHEVDGNWPVEGGEAAQGTSGVIEAVTAGEGTIGYADASQAGDLGVALIQVGDEYVGPTPQAAAAILDNSEEVAPDDSIFAYELDRETEASGTYPIVLVSYEIACTAYEDQAQADIVREFLRYVISPEGQRAAAQNAGSAPISEALRAQVEPVVDAIGAGS